MTFHRALVAIGFAFILICEPLFAQRTSADSSNAPVAHPTAALKVTNTPLKITAMSQKQICGIPLDGSTTEVQCFPETRLLNMAMGPAHSLIAAEPATCAADNQGWRCWGWGSLLNDEQLTIIDGANVGDLISGGRTFCRIRNSNSVQCVGSTLWKPSNLISQSHEPNRAAPEAESLAENRTQNRAQHRNQTPFQTQSANSATNGDDSDASPSKLGTTFGPFHDLRAAAVSSWNFCAIDGEHLQCTTSAYTLDLQTPKTPIAGARLLALGEETVCVIGTRGLQCWDTQQEQAQMARPDWINAKALVGRGDHFCAIVSGGVSCVSAKSASSPLASPPPHISVAHAGVEEISLGSNHACARLNTGDIHCWGDNSLGQTLVPQGLPKSIRITGGSKHTCSLGINGEISCWGGDEYGKLNRPLPKGGPLAISMNEFMACVWNENGVFCSSSGAAQNDPMLNIPNLRNVQAIALTPALGADNACALYRAPNSQLNKVRCWGYSPEVANVPETLNQPRTIAVTASSACAVTASDAVVCWGKSILANTPDKLDRGRKFLLSSRHGCALDRLGFFCWGDLEDNGLEVPNKFSDINVVADFALGSSHTCVLDVDSKVTCWGTNLSGQTNVPEELDQPVAVAAYGSISCATDANGVTCWGETEALSKALSQGPASPAKGRTE